MQGRLLASGEFAWDGLVEYSVCRVSVLIPQTLHGLLIGFNPSQHLLTLQNYTLLLDTAEFLWRNKPFEILTGSLSAKRKATLNVRRALIITNNRLLELSLISGLTCTAITNRPYHAPTNIIMMEVSIIDRRNLEGKYPSWFLSDFFTSLLYLWSCNSKPSL